MAVKRRGRGIWWSRFHFLIRFIGLTSLLVAGVGAALAFRYNLLTRRHLLDIDWLRSTIEGHGPLEGSDRIRGQIAFCLIIGGLALAALALIFEVLATLSTVLGRRGAFGFNATLQAALAIALVVGANWFSFRHYLRFDWTRNHDFTLATSLQGQLRNLRGEAMDAGSGEKFGKTTIVVYERHKTFGQFNDKPDAYDYAAERKVVEKVHDVVDEFREFAPEQFEVVVLDVEEDRFNEKLDALAKKHPGLREAVDSAPENTIFFCAAGRVQQLSFKDYLYLDKTDSIREQNLVLLDQGVEPFARKVLNVDEKRPKVGVLVIHEWLTTMGPEDFGMAGLKKALSAHGFQVEDVILKKWSEAAPPEAAVYSYDESKLDRLEEEIAEVDSELRNLREEVRELTEVQNLWKTSTLDQLTKQYAKQLGGRKVDEGLRRRQLAFFEQNLLLARAFLGQYETDRKNTLAERGKINVEQATEQRRMTDMRAKLSRMLAGYDLVIVPRMTIRNVILGDRIPSSLHRLDEAQVDAIKDYLASGKPLLACLGPSSEHPSDRMRMMQFGGGGTDELETMLGQIGIKLNKQTVLHNVETKAFAERRTGLLISGAVVEVPTVEFDTSKGKANPLAKEEAASLPPNPISLAMNIAADSLGRKLDIRIQNPRPVYYQAPADADKPTFSPEFMMTSAASWNDDSPFPSQQRTPRFEPSKPDDPAKGTIEEKRRGPFPIGVAVPALIPKEWYPYDKPTQATSRVAVIGSGSVFVGAALAPAKEELLLDTCNWLLSRDDLLPNANVVWKYPRVRMNDKDKDLWRWTGWFVLPGLFAYAGLMVLLVRRLR